jgi:hypothetical protein
MPWARSSALDRHLECAAASWLPRTDRGQWQQGYLVATPLVVDPKWPTPENDSMLADWGTQMHLAKEGAPNACDPWLSWMEPHRERLWPTGLGVHEQPWSFDCRTGAVEMWTPADGDKDRWKASRGPSCITGTTDWHGWIPSGEPWVDDLKTGFYPPAVTCPQMLMYALIAAKVTGHPTVRLSITHWRRGWEDPERKWQQVGPVTLEAFEDELRAAWARAAGPNPMPRAGSHCRYCPSSAVCPTVVGEPQKESE